MPFRPRPFALALAFLLLPFAAQATCARAVSVPMAPIGLSVFVTAEGQLAGVYPDLLQKMSLPAGCSFQVSEVPRARQESLFENGKADILIPASHSPRRDKYGLFVPLIGRRATVIGVAGERKPVENMKDLLARTDLRVALVRGFDFGQAYLDMVNELARQNRVMYDKDPASVARLLKEGLADVTVMAPSILIGSLLADKRNAALIDSLRIEPIEELAWDESGLYLSLTSLTPAERDALREHFEKAARGGAVWKAFQLHYPAKALAGSIRPR